MTVCSSAQPAAFFIIHFATFWCFVDISLFRTALRLNYDNYCCQQTKFFLAVIESVPSACTGQCASLAFLAAYRSSHLILSYHRTHTPPAFISFFTGCGFLQITFLPVCVHVYSLTDDIFHCLLSKNPNTFNFTHLSSSHLYRSDPIKSNSFPAFSILPFTQIYTNG